jgi:hypothetical protein
MREIMLSIDRKFREAEYRRALLPGQSAAATDVATSLHRA